MTREEILAMEPGPGMDALVAERVLGRERMDTPHGVLFKSDGSWCGASAGPAHPYSTSDAAALEVLAAACEDGYVKDYGPTGNAAELWREYRSPETEPTLWRVTFGRAEGVIRQWSAHAPTLALAICRAALLSKLR